MRTILARLAIVISLLGMMVYGINPPPVQATTLDLGGSSGTPGSQLGISGNGTAGETINVTFGTTAVASGIPTNSTTGLWSTTITVPHLPAGSYSITATGTSSGAASRSFQVVAGITASATTGPVGTSVTVTGIGYGNAESGITVKWDGTAIAPAQAASTAGDVTVTFAVPSTPAGSHAITMDGASTGSPRTISFSVTPSVAASKTSGAPGSTVTITGSGFYASETGITVNYDGTAIQSGIIANSQGYWTTNITIPPSPAGPHIIHGYGSVTTPAATSDISFVVGAGITANQTSGAQGSSLTVTGSGFSTGETGITVTFDSTTVAASVRAGSTGGWTATFTVPAAPGGAHSISAIGPITTSAPSLTFTINPTVTANQPSGAPGSTLIINGTGFGASETGITVTYDGNNVATGIRANASGAWTANFLIPASPAGSHTIHAQGPITQAASTPDVNFSVTPGLTGSLASGSPGTSMTATGSGYAANETGITVTYDNANVATGIKANASGGWTATFNVPPSAAGAHNLHAYGSTTLAAMTPDFVFTVTPGLTISQATGAPGSSITITGTGFNANETGITITYDSTNVATGIKANAQGSWSTTFTVPPSSAGAHSIAAFGAVTQAATVNAASFTTAASITLNPPAGFVGATVQIDGYGFGVNSPLKFAYDDKDLGITGVTTDSAGSFSQTVTIPKSTRGAHSIRVTDGQRNDVKVTFTMDSTAPPVPAPQSPDDGARVGVLGEVMPTFRWAAVPDPSGVSYQLQIDTIPDFTQPILDRTDIARNQYTLTAAEALPLGEYYWRVRATDQAANQSAWSEPRQLKSGLMPLTTLLVLIVVAVAIVAFAAWYVFVRRRVFQKREAVGVAEGEAPRVVVTGQWRQIESPQSEDQPQRERPMPLRLAMPAPAKGQKTLSTEEQARLKVIVDFAQSIPLVEAGYTVNWLLDLMESGTDIKPSLPIYEQLLKGDLQVRYEPAWTHHPTYQDLTALLEGQPVLQDLNAFVDAVNRCAADITSIMQDIYRDCLAEVPQGFLEKGGWNFVSGVYADATSWYLGKSLRDPSERDYSVKPRPDQDEGGLWLHGEDTTAFGGPLMQAADEREALKLRGLHLKLRRNYRNNPKAKDVVSTMTQIEVQRSRLLSLFSQFGRLRQ